MNNPRDFCVFLEKEDPFQTAGTVVFSPCFKTFAMIYNYGCELYRKKALPGLGIYHGAADMAGMVSLLLK